MVNQDKMENSLVVSVSSSISHHNLDNLPDLVYYYLLKNLDLDDLSCLRLVSKKFNFIVKHHKIIELSFYSANNNLGNWFSTNRSTKYGNRLHFSKQSLLRSPPDNLMNLKYLKVFIGDHPPSRFSTRLNDLNKFTKLQILQIGIIKSSSNHLLQLSSLKALSIRFHCNLSELNSMTIDTPNLQNLAIRNEYFNSNQTGLTNVINFSHPQSIKYLLIDCYDKNVPIFINLECLEIRTSLVHLKADDLLQFNNLKKISFYHCSLDKRDVLKDLFKSKKSNLEFVLNGVKIKEANKIDTYDTRFFGLRFQLNNYGELEDNLNFAHFIDYFELISLLPNQPSDLFNKYTGIQTLVINSRIEDGNRLIHFIRRCSSINYVLTFNSSFKQRFYDQLPEVSTLTGLKIAKNEDDLNYEFILKMPYLFNFFTDQDVLINKQLNLNNFKRLKEFEFKINNKEIKIRKENRDRYRVDDRNKLLGLPDHEYINHNKLIKWCNWLRNKREASSRKRKLPI